MVFKIKTIKKTFSHLKQYFVILKYRGICKYVKINLIYKTEEIHGAKIKDDFFY